MNHLLVRVSQGMFLLLAGLLMMAGPAQAQDAASTYKAKCAMCHGPDGKGDNAMGKKLGAHDFASPEVAKQSDDELAGIIAKGKAKMPGYEKSLKPEQIKALVTYIRSLAKK
ncbi:MAG: c-type cytochrome [Candidatus Acidiferrales bacterium]